jgi:putative ABC transport system permease protein
VAGPRWLREGRLWRRPVDREVDEELAFHLVMRAELYQSGGMDPQTARDTALQRFGDVAEVRTRCITLGHERERRMKRMEVWEAARQHARYALRRLGAAPGFTTAVLAMLALGIGATTAVFSVVYGVLLRPLPFGEPDRLVALSHSIAISGITRVEQSDGTYMLYRRHARSFESMGAYRERDVNLGALGGQEMDAERVSAATVTASLLPTLRAAPVLGRGFRADEDRKGAAPVVILSSGLWHRKFGGDPSVVGRRLVVDGLAREVIGIMGDGFRYPTAHTAVWVPLVLDPADASPLSFNFNGVARLKPGYTAERARAELAGYLPRLLDEFPMPVPREMLEKAQLRPLVTPLRDAVVGDVGRLLWILLGAAALLLLIACANVASLFLVRAEGAHREIAVRMSLGAGQRAVLAQYLAEALLLALGGGVLGVVMAFAGIRALRTLPAGVELPRLHEVGLDGRVLLAAAAASALSALAVSLLPVLRARRISPAVVLKESSRSATAGRDRQRARSALVIAQVALALVLVAGSALMVRSFAGLRQVRPGFDARNVLTLRISLPRGKYADPAVTLALWEGLLAQVRALPGVRYAGVTDWLPLTDDHNDSAVQVEDHPLPPDEVPPDHTLSAVSADYFAATGVPLLRGRGFGSEDAAHPSTDVIISRSFAERYWKGGDPIGKRLRQGLSGHWSTIVGVVGDVHLTSLEKPADEMIYFPFATPAQDGGGTDVPHVAAVVVKTSGGDPAQLAPAVRAIVRRLDPALPTFDERPMEVLLRDAVARTRFVLLMLGIASLVALAIGAVGLYGVLAYGVSLRRREIGVRIALGATASEVSRMIARRGVALATAGVAAGLVAAVALTRFLHGLLYGVSPTDPLALAGTSVMLLGVALLATWLPARRAAMVDPMEALRRD